MINIQSSEKEDFPSNVKKTESVEELDTEDRNMDRMKYVLKSMIQKLEMHIEKTDKALGDKLQRLDLDRDGMLDSEELRGAVAGVLKRYSTPEEAQNLVTILDKDKDGKGELSNKHFLSICNNMIYVL
jgi:Ca2+-binding EF-hand superfamily protein